MFGKTVGRILFKREYSTLDAIKQDFGTFKLVLFFTAAILAVSFISISVSPIIKMLSDAWSIPLKVVYFEALSILTVIFFLSLIIVIVLSGRRTTIITDMGILYGGIFQRWEEIRCYVIHKTHKGTVIWIYSRQPLKDMRMHFRRNDSHIVEKFFMDYCKNARGYHHGIWHGDINARE